MVNKDMLIYLWCSNFCLALHYLLTNAFPLALPLGCLYLALFQFPRANLSKHCYVSLIVSKILEKQLLSI